MAPMLDARCWHDLKERLSIWRFAIISRWVVKFVRKMFLCDPSSWPVDHTHEGQTFALLCVLCTGNDTQTPAVVLLDQVGGTAKS